MRRILLVCGARTWGNPDRLRRAPAEEAARVEDALRAERTRAAAELALYPPDRWSILHGAGTGADNLVDALARASGYKVEAMPADWDAAGPPGSPERNTAGPRRNEAMARRGPAEGLAFGSLQRPDGSRCSGTGDMVRRLRARGVRVRWVPAADAETQVLALRVRTARLSRKLVGSSVLNITRQSGGEAGKPFAPSWALVRPVVELRQLLSALLAQASAPSNLVSPADVDARVLALQDELERAWVRYVPAYIDEMRQSYVEHRAAWQRLLAQDEVTLACYCADPERCHRRILAGILVKLGAIDLGESVESVQADLQRTLPGMAAR